MEIAVFVDDNGNALPLYATGNVDLYALEEGEWINVKKVPFSINENMGMVEIRKRIFSLVKELGGCKIFLAQTIKGIPYTILEGMGMSIWKIIGSPVKHLTYVYEQEKKLKAEKLKPKPSVVGDIRDGVYFFDMSKALNRNNSFTSKQLLLPFLKRTAFQRLEIICEHIPLWFEKEFHSLKLKLEIKNSTDGLCHAIITHN